MPKVLMVFATTDGHTRKICERIDQQLRIKGSEATLVEVVDAGNIDPAPYDCIVVGGSVRYGKHDAGLQEFMLHHEGLLRDRYCAFFSVNLIARVPEKRIIEGNVYVRKFIEALPFQPDHIEIIAGKLDYPSYGFLDRLMIRLIMRMTGGPTDPETVIEYTDWDGVDQFAERIAAASKKSRTEPEKEPE